MRKKILNFFWSILTFLFISGKWAQIITIKLSDVFKKKYY